MGSTPVCVASGRTVQAEAFERALQKIWSISPQLTRNEKILDSVFASVLDATSSGRPDADAVADLAVRRAAAVHHALTGKSMTQANE